MTQQQREEKLKDRRDYRATLQRRIAELEKKLEDVEKEINKLK